MANSESGHRVAENSLARTLKRWGKEDPYEASINRDLFATAKLCEILGLCSVDAARAFEASFRELADLGYAGYCYYDFASVSMLGILDAYQELLREHTGDAELESIHIWMWSRQFMNARVPDSTGTVKMVVKNSTEPDATGIFFGRFLRCDSKFGIEAGRTSKIDLIDRFRHEIKELHTGFAGLGLPDKDIAILRTMDLINSMFPQPGDERFIQRVPFNHAFTDIGAGRWIDGDRYGHLFIYPDGSIGVEGVSGFENERHVIALGIEKILQTQRSIAA
jgi:hypothetical protein